MENNQILETILHEIKDIKTDMNNMKSDMQSMKSDMNDMKADIQELKDRTINIELTLENETNKHIKWLADGHASLVQSIDEIKKDTGKIEEIDTKLFATRGVTKDNVHRINKLEKKIR